MTTQLDHSTAPDKQKCCQVSHGVTTAETHAVRKRGNWYERDECRWQAKTASCSKFVIHSSPRIRTQTPTQCFVAPQHRWILAQLHTYPESDRHDALDLEKTGWGKFLLVLMSSCATAAAYAKSSRQLITGSEHPRVNLAPLVLKKVAQLPGS